MSDEYWGDGFSGDSERALSEVARLRGEVVRLTAFIETVPLAVAGVKSDIESGKHTHAVLTLSELMEQAEAIAANSAACQWRGR